MKIEARDTPAIDDARSTVFGVACTLVLMLAYFGFIGLGAFAPGVLARPVLAGGTVTIAFAYGLFVIGLGVALTSIYVWVASRRAG